MIVLPFVCVRKVVMYNSKLRVIINDFNCSCHEEGLNETREIDPSEITHLINFKTLTPQRRVIVQDSLVPSDARMIIDEKDEIAAAIDIFLDIAIDITIPINPPNNALNPPVVNFPFNKLLK